MPTPEANIMKRFFDICFSAFMLLLLSPLLLLISLAIKLTSRGPVLYRGERVGLKGRKFRICKFRSMVIDAEKKGGSSTGDDDPRITRVGKLIRRFKLDELPQFLNVLVGDMSVVGPRPQVQWAVDLYTEEQKKLLDVRPGITDNASIRFRNEGEILKGAADPDKAYLELIAPEKIRLGLEYVRNQSLLLDLHIIFLTVFSLFVPPKSGVVDEPTPSAR
jgi:lipopolysaccharide/colanic/teichoic acid biosynthesis glycosyltransferase